MTNNLLPAFAKGRILLEQIDLAKKQGGDKHFNIWWLGQSGFLIQWNGRLLLFDPYLSDSLTKKYKDTAKPHVRMSELVIEPALLSGLDVITSSHNHTDHLDADTLIPILKNNPGIAFIIPEANRGFVADRVNCPLSFPVGLNDGEKMEMKGFTFYGVPAAHNTVERDEQGRCRYMGFVVQFGSWCIYHSGDTVWYDGIVETLKPFRPDVAFLPINGNDPKRGVAGNLNAEEAAQLGVQIGARLVIPHHYNMFEFNTADPREFTTVADKLKIQHRVLELGENFSYPVREAFS